MATLVREAPHVDLCENARDRARARERALSLMVDDGLRSEAHERERDRTSQRGPQSRSEKKYHVVQEGRRNGLIADRYESVAARSPTKLGGIIEGTRAVMENKVRTPGGQIYTLPERWQIEPR